MLKHFTYSTVVVITISIEKLYRKCFLNIFKAYPVVRKTVSPTGFYF